MCYGNICTLIKQGQNIRQGTYHSELQGGAGGLAVGWVDLDLECSTILLGQ